jgi:hypothetical protein
MVVTACSPAQDSSSATTATTRPEVADPNDGIATNSELADIFATGLLRNPEAADAVRKLDDSILQTDAAKLCEAARTSRKLAFDTLLSASLPNISIEVARVVFVGLAKAACLDQWNNTISNV